MEKLRGSAGSRMTWFASLYMDYGLLNINTVPKDATDMFYYKQTDEGVKYYVTPLLLSKPAYDAAFNNKFKKTRYGSITRDVQGRKIL